MDLSQVSCPIELTLTLIGEKWKVLILRDLLTGTKRFGQLQRSIHGVSQKMLTQQLRSLEADGIILRTVYAEVPPKVEYSLTELGQSLLPVLKSLASWGMDYKERFEVVTAPNFPTRPVLGKTPFSCCWEGEAQQEKQSR